MKVRREVHWKPQSPVRKGGVVYLAQELLSLQPEANLWRFRLKSYLLKRVLKTTQFKHTYHDPKNITLFALC